MHQNTTYDYLIVGAGSAGAILAARLSEDPKVNVLLLEAGPAYRSADATPEMRSANAFGIMDASRSPTYHWHDIPARRTARQETRPYVRGHGLGGSSAINAQMAHRAPLEDFDWWAEQGCTGWSGEELLPAMNRLENDLDFGDAFYHGNRGPITMYRTPIPHWGKVDLALLQAGLALGYLWHSDLNAPDSSGISGCPVNRSPHSRVSTNDGYLEPARGRPNLTILGDTLVDKVLFDGPRAAGVRAHRDGSWTELLGHEVILSSGPIMSPAILLRSGVGPAEELRPLGIEPRADLPVGRNLRDHPNIAFLMSLRADARAHSWDDRMLNCVIRYSSRLAGAGDNDMIVLCANLTGYDEAGLEHGALVVSVWQAFSEGSLRLTNANPFTPPFIDERLLSDERDMVRMRDGVRRLTAIARHPSMQAIAASVTTAPFGPDNERLSLEALDDNQALDDWLQAAVVDLYHITGTCRMGAPDDPRTVVDPGCRVIGVEQLRVIDGSIMPDVTRSNTNLPIMTIAEHMAARLKAR